MCLGMLCRVGKVMFIHSKQVDKTAPSTLIFSPQWEYIRRVGRVLIPSLPLITAKKSALGLILFCFLPVFEVNSGAVTLLP